MDFSKASWAHMFNSEKISKLQQQLIAAENISSFFSSFIYEEIFVYSINFWYPCEDDLINTSIHMIHNFIWLSHTTIMVPVILVNSL